MTAVRTPLLHEAFEAHVRARPRAAAVRLADREVSYAELDAMADGFARRLRELGVGPEQLVGVCVRRSVEHLAAILSVLKVGGAFVLLDPSDPSNRIEAVIQDAEPRAVFAHDQDRACVRTAEVLSLESPTSRPHDTGSATGVEPEHAFCVCYTSGSSGEPKGVVLEHRSVLNQLTWVDRTLLGERGLVMPLVSPLTFAASLKQLFVPWLRGEAVWLLSERTVEDPVELLRELARNPQVALNCVPPLWEMMLDVAQAGLAPMPETVEVVCFAGDSPAQSLVDRSLAALPGLELWNIYAATETGISTACRIGEGESLSIGRPIANVEAHVLDDDLEPVGSGGAGVLYVGGPGLARCYLRRPELSAERFVERRLDGSGAARLFKTGDVVRRRDDGSLEFVTRSDRVLKVRGFRIDPTEVEEAIRQHPGVARCAVGDVRDQRGNDRLVAHLVLDGAPAPTVAELRHFLGSRLPSYMLPSRLVVLDELPTTPSGKIHRRALRLVDGRRLPSGPAWEGPTNRLERRIMKLWKRVLELDSVGVTDDFFELGGDSLSATRVTGYLERKTGVELLPSILLEASTPERLAKHIARSRPGQEPSALVTIRPGGERRPLFCVAPRSLSLRPLRRLSRHLDPEIPLHVLQSYGLEDDVGAPIEGIAARYVAAVRGVQPQGPYLLAGHCKGSMIALEAAQQLQAQGDVVSLLVIFDGPPPQLRTPTQETARRHESRRARRWRLIKRRATRLARRPRRLRRDIERAFRGASDAGSVTPRSFLSFYRQRQLIFGLDENRAAYTAEPYSGRICHFLSEVRADQADRFYELGWRAIGGDGVECIVVPGTHHDLLDEPAVREVAEHLDRHLQAE